MKSEVPPGATRPLDAPKNMGDPNRSATLVKINSSFARVMATYKIRRSSSIAAKSSSDRLCG